MAVFRAAFAHFGTTFGTSTRAVHHDARVDMRIGALRAGIMGRPPVARLFRA